MVHLHKKNLETLMKSRNEFTTNEEYNEYLRIYFAGLALQGIIAGRKDELYKIKDETIKIYVELSIKSADELLKQLEKK